MYVRRVDSVHRGLLFGLFKGGFKASVGSVSWHRSSYGTDLANSEIASLAPSLSW